MNLGTLLPDLGTLLKGYRNQDFSPAQVIDQLIARADSYADRNIWIRRLSRAELDPYLARLTECEPGTLPLYGIPFLIKDNIDLAGVPTTAACEAYSHTPAVNAFVVERLLAAGAIPLGKTNMDQFATGLVGTRSPPPWGPCRNAFDPAWISGGSSSGSAVGLALGLASFSLGTDTAGSGRVPAMLNNLYGLKPTRGILSMSGILPACRSLDCPSIFALCAEDARTVFNVMLARDDKDSYARENPFRNSRRATHTAASTPRIAVPRTSQRTFNGNEGNAILFEAAIARWLELGAEITEIDISPMLEAAQQLYDGPWVAERYAALDTFLSDHREALDPVVGGIIGPAADLTAVAMWQAQYRMQASRQQAMRVMAPVDFLMLPTAPTSFPVDEVLADPVRLNSLLGHYTNFMNLLDFCGVAVPAGFTASGQPFGVTLAAPAFADQQLLNYAALWQRSIGLTAGATGQSVAEEVGAEPAPTGVATDVEIEVAVCGAHLSGQPLNWQLTERGARCVAVTCTSPHYRLFALPGAGIPRPGMVRVVEGEGIGVPVEVWSVPAVEFGGFVANVPAPLCIGKVQLAGQRWVSGFLCEQWATAKATDISHFGGWEAYLAFEVK